MKLDPASDTQLSAYVAASWACDFEKLWKFGREHYWSTETQ